MSTTIDEKVVEMRFDGQDFIKNTKESLLSLDKLKQGLKLDGATKGFENVGDAANKLSFSGLTTAADAVAVKFSYMQMAIANQFNKIVDSAVSAGKRVVSAFTTEPIKAGFQEYETQINAVQTILANTSSKGTTLDQVNAALDTLNQYADKTIYNFTEMTRNIGTFTAAGIELDTATSAIQGIANLAAVSGSTSQQASTAMYQLSQALSSGTVKLQDWNSVVNAGMGGQVFQDALKDTSRFMAQQAKDLKKMSKEQREAWRESNGYSAEQLESMMKYSANVDKLIDKHGSFRESLTAGWITADVLTMTLNKMTKTGVVDYIANMTGASKESVAELQKLGDEFGYDSEEAKKLADSIANGDEEMAKMVLDTVKMATTAEDAATKVKTFTQLMDTLKEAAQSGWTQTWELLIGDFEEAKELWTSVSDYLGNVINKSSEARNGIIKGWIDMGGRTQVINALKNAFGGLLNILEPIKAAFVDVFPPITAKKIYAFSTKLEELTGRFKEFTSKHASNINRAFHGIFSAIDIGLTFVKSLGKGIIDLAKNLTGLTGGLLDGAAALGVWLSGLRTRVKDTDIFGTAIGKITGVIQTAIVKFKEFCSVISAKISFPSLDTIRSVVSTIAEHIGNAARAIGGFLSEVGKGIGEFIAKTDMASVMKTLNGALLTGVFVKLSGLMKNGGGVLGELKDTIGGIKDMLLGLNEKKSEGGLLDALKDGLSSLQEAVSVNKIIKIAVAVGILAVALKVISTIDSDKISGALLGLGAVFGELVGAIALFDKFGLSGSDKGLGSLIGLAATMLIMSVALKKLGDLDWGQIGRGLTAMGGVLLELVGFTKLMGNSKIGVGSMIGLIALAVSLKIFASAMSDFAEFNWDQILTGLAGMGGVLFELGVFSRLVSGNKNMVNIGVGLIAIAAAMKIFASAMSDFSKFNWEQIKTGLAGMGGSLGAVAIATRVMPKNMIGIGVGLLIVSAALHVMASALAKFGNLNEDQINNGLMSIGVLLTELAIALNFMKGTLGGSAALLVASAALAILAIPMLLLSKLTWGELAKGLIAIAGSLVIVGAAGAAFGTVAPSILLGSVALAAMGAAMLLLVPVFAAFGAMKFGDIIKSILGIALAFVVLGAVAAVLGIVSPLILAFGAAVVVVGAGVALFGAGLAAIGVGLSMIGGALEVFVTAVGNSAEALMTNISVIINVIIISIARIVDGIILLVPKFVEAGITILMSFLQGIRDNIYQIVTTVGELITEFLTALAEQLPTIIEAGMNLIVQFINGLATSLTEHGPTLGAALSNLFIAGINTVISFLTGGAVASIKDAAQKIMNSGFIRGITDKVSAVKTAFTDGIDKAKTAVRNKVSEWTSIGKNILDGMIKGIKDKATSLVNAAKGVINDAIKAAKNLLGIKSPSRVFAEMGRYVDEGFVVGMQAYAGRVVDATEDLGRSAVGSMSNIVKNITDTINDNIDAQPTIRPVLDLTNVESGAGRLNSMLSRTRAMSISASMNRGYDSEIQNGTTPAETTYQFVQNNYSPKSLSRLEIYRQTQNQLETLKGLVKT